jgi:predicted kinase
MISPSGSGKSTLAKKLVDEKNIFSTDSLFYESGEYKFDPAKLGENHTKNFSLFKEAVEAGEKAVCCDNTNLRLEDVKKYKKEAEKWGYKVVLKTGLLPAWTSYVAAKNQTVGEKKKIAKILFKSNVHDVPLNTIEKMIDNFWKVWGKTKDL